LLTKNSAVALGAELLEHYRTHGYAVVPDVVPDSVFEDAWEVIDPWVDAVIRGWVDAGLIDGEFRDRGRWDRLRDAWRAAGEPHFRRQPYKHLMTPAMYRLMRTPALCEVAAQIIGTPDLAIHGVFNARPQLPSADPVHLTPFHQDAQYWHLDYDGPEPDVERKTHVMTMWIPLRDVDETSGALRVMSTRETGNVMFEPYDYDRKRTGMLGLSPADVARHTPIPIPLRRGDALVFTQRTPHGATPLGTSPLRWCIDIRYEAAATRTHIGKKFGFVVRSESGSPSETPLEAWLSQRQA
jgi:ectoine hydroxylase-related dioxygenase (phytanoyl-CoA dioxygenase family)